MTRAHMMVLVVNECIAGGWFEFLTGVRLTKDKKFDAKQAGKGKSADRTIARAKRLQREEDAKAKKKQQEGLKSIE